MKMMLDLNFFEGKRALIDLEQVCLIEEYDNHSCIITMASGREIRIRETMDEVRRQLRVVAEIQYETERNREEKR